MSSSSNQRTESIPTRSATAAQSRYDEHCPACEKPYADGDESLVSCDGRHADQEVWYHCTCVGFDPESADDSSWFGPCCEEEKQFWFRTLRGIVEVEVERRLRKCIKATAETIASLARDGAGKDASRPGTSSTSPTSSPKHPASNSVDSAETVWNDYPTDGTPRLLKRKTEATIIRPVHRKGTPRLAPSMRASTPESDSGDNNSDHHSLYEHHGKSKPRSAKAEQKRKTTSVVEKKQEPWTDEQAGIAIKAIGEMVALRKAYPDRRQYRGEKSHFGHAEKALKKAGFDRGFGSIRNWWSREGRAASGIEEREPRKDGAPRKVRTAVRSGAKSSPPQAAAKQTKPATIGGSRQVDAQETRREGRKMGRRGGGERIEEEGDLIEEDPEFVGDELDRKTAALFEEGRRTGEWGPSKRSRDEDSAPHKRARH